MDPNPNPIQQIPMPMQYRPNFTGGISASFQGMPNSMRSPAMGMMAVYPMPSISDQLEKKKEFSRGIYVTGFEKTLTAVMLQDHFKIKPIQGMKLPISKFNENKGFAFIYYGSEDDASFVKQKLDHSIILKNKIRVTRTVIAQNLSKMMFRLKVENLTSKEIEEAQQNFFNEQALEKAVQKIIEPLFGDSIKVNKITVPISKKDKKTPLKYARVFFYVSNLKEASSKVKSNVEIDDKDKEKNEYEIVLSYISDLLNNDNQFKRYVKSQIYEYSKKNQTNILHFKGIKTEKNQPPEAIAEELKAFVQEQCRQAKVLGCYVSIYQSTAWANITFSSYAETIAAYEHFKNNKIKFRGVFLYANMRNIKDLRTVVVSTVRGNDNVTNKDMENFLTELAAQSSRVDPNDEQKGRKYDFFSFNIIEQKSYYLGKDDETVIVSENEPVQKYWRLNNIVPRRVVIHFMNEINEEDTRELVNEIKRQPNWERIFIEKDSKTPLRANHQKGHIKDGLYVKHTDLKGKKKVKRSNQPQRDRNNISRGKIDGGIRKPGITNPTTDFTQYQFKQGRGNPPRINPGQGGPNPKSSMPGRNPIMGKPMNTGMGMGGVGMGGMGGNPLLGQMSLPAIGVNPITYTSKMNPPTNYIPPSFVGNKPPMMGQPMMGQPMMGQPMMGQPMMGQPMMGQPMMGQPMMGQPMMGQPMMGQIPPGLNRPEQKKQ